MKLRRFWFEFDLASGEHPLSLLTMGCGVTGFDEGDCEGLIKQQIARGEELPPVRRVIRDVDVSTLDAKHVLPNMGVVVRRGVWFPHLPGV